MPITADWKASLENNNVAEFTASFVDSLGNTVNTTATASLTTARTGTYSARVSGSLAGVYGGALASNTFWLSGHVNTQGSSTAGENGCPIMGMWGAKT